MDRSSGINTQVELSLLLRPMHIALQWQISALCLVLLIGSGIAVPISRRIGSTSEYEHPTFPLPPTPEQCVLEHATVLIRHGARNPTKSNIKAMSDLESYLLSHPQLVDKIIAHRPDLNFLKHWRNPFKLEEAGHLHPTGMDQLYKIAKRLRQGVLSNLVDERGYLPFKHRFYSTETPRTQKSARAWYNGFFFDSEDQGEALIEKLHVEIQPKTADWDLRFFEACAKYYSADAEGLFHHEHDLFAPISVNWDATLDRLGLVPHDDDDDDDEEQTKAFRDDLKRFLPTMYRLCAFEASLNGTENQYCNIFEEEELEAMEYLKDLYFFWARSHGNQDSMKLATPLIRKMISNLDEIVKNSTTSEIGRVEVPVKAIHEDSASLHFYFAHAETLVPFISLLGLYDDSVDWRHNTPKEQWKTRSFKSSHITPFSANFALLLYDCQGDGKFMRALHNERELVIPGCSAHICPYGEFRQSITPILEVDHLEVCDRDWV